MLINNYSDLVLETPGCHPGTLIYLVKFKVDADLTPLLGYINAAGQDSAYYENAQSVQFTLNGIRCAISPEQIHAAEFKTRDQAVAFVGELIVFLNDLDQKKETIEPNFTAFKQIPVIEIFKLLPKTNCKACGYSTCLAFAARLSKGEAEVADCPELENPESLKNLLS